jgi:hypothetical protein
VAAAATVTVAALSMTAAVPVGAVAG